MEETNPSDFIVRFQYNGQELVLNEQYLTVNVSFHKDGLEKTLMMAPEGIRHMILSMLENANIQDG